MARLRESVKMLREKRSKLERKATKGHPMVAASFLARRLKADGPNVYYLSASIDGESRHRYVRKKEAGYWRKRALQWREFSQAMTSLVEVNKQIGQALRALGRLRCERLPGGDKKGRRYQ